MGHRIRNAKVRVVPIPLKKGTPFRFGDEKDVGDPTFMLTQRIALGDDRFEKPYAQHGYLFAAVNDLALNIGGVPYQIKRGTAKKSTVVESGPLVDLFNQPNKDTDGTMFWQLVTIYLHLQGEAIVHLVGKGGVQFQQGQVPAAMYVHPGHRFTPVTQDADGNETNTIMAWTYRTSKGEEVRLDWWEIIQIRFPNPYKPLRGLAPLEAALRGLRTDYKAALFNEAFFENGCDLGGTITQEGGGTTDTRTHERNIEQRHKGSKNAKKIMVLPAGMQFHPNDQTHHDMEFLDGRKFTIGEIAAVFRVPKTRLMEYESINYATALSQDYCYWKNTLQPLGRALERAFLTRLFKMIQGGPYFGAFDYSTVPALLVELKDKIEAASALVDMGYTLNQANERVGLGMPDVDETPAPADQPPPTPPPADDPNADAPPPPKKHKDAPQPFQARQAWHDYARKQYPKRERRWVMRLGIFFGQQRAEVLGRLKKRAELVGQKAAGRKDLNEDDVDEILFAQREWDAKLRRLARPLYKETAAAEIAQLADELGSLESFTAQDPNLLRFLEAKEIKVVGINDTTREKLRASLREGIANGETLDALTDRVKGVFEVVGGSGRKRTIARTETSSVLNNTRYLGFKEEGVEYHEWLTAGDEAVRETHQIDGEVRRVGDAFPKNGLHFPQEEGAAAEEVINCRCSVIAAKGPKEDGA